MHNYKNKTYKQEKGRKRRKAKHIGEGSGGGGNREEMKVLRAKGRGGREKLGHITGKDREKDSYRGEENRSNTSSHAKCRGPMTFYQSRAFFFFSVWN